MPKKSSAEPVHKDLPGAKFKIDQAVISNHRQNLYRAKVINVKEVPRACKFAYYVHYQGWNKKWDEWVDEDRVINDDEEGQKRMKEVAEQIAAARLAAKRKGKAPKSERSNKRSKKSGKAEAQEEEETKASSKTSKKKPGKQFGFNLKISNKLKHFLVNDWEQVTREKRLVPLPRKPTITEIMKLFLEAKKRNPESQNILNEVVKGLSALFQNAVGRVLLYKFERPQFAAQTSKNYCDVYGAEHFLRLFVKLPELLKDAKLTPEELKVLNSKLQEFLQFLDKNQSKFFTSDYIGTDAEYQQKYVQVDSAENDT